MTEQNYSILFLIIIGLCLMISVYRILTVNKSITDNTKKWDINKQTLNVILGLAAGLSISTGLRVLIIGITGLLTKDLDENIQAINSNQLFAQLVNSTGYIAIGGIIFIILGVRAMVASLKKY